MTSRYDIAIIGAGILGVTIAYWISKISKHSVVIIDKEREVAFHTSSRNTGVVHRPFYLNPQKKRLFASAAQESYFLWEKLAAAYHLPWAPIGTLEVALNDTQLTHLGEYENWAFQNGMKGSEIELLDRAGVQKIEPEVECAGAILSKTDTAVSYQEFTRAIFELAKSQGVEFKGSSKVVSIRERSEGNEILLQTNESRASDLFCGFVINSAGGNAVDIAHLMNLGKEFTDLHFRGEYWFVEKTFGQKISRNVYSVPKIKEYPFLDPHFIVRANGSREVGPNAVLVSGPNTYKGFSQSTGELVSKIFERPLFPKVKLFIDKQFLSLVWHEWKSSISKKQMCERAREFIPALSVDKLIRKGNAGVRSSLIDRNGFVSEAVFLEGVRSFHILNYNSPGATGAPAFSAFVVKKLIGNGFIARSSEKQTDGDLQWNFDKASEIGGKL
jgi:(S)-2-hydroxyglutarate dehydrogenase